MNEDIILKTINEKKMLPWWNKSEQTVIGRYGKIFNPLNIDNLTYEDFKSFLLIKNNLHWEGIHRQVGIITSDMEKLKTFLKNLLDEAIPLKERLIKLFNKKGNCVVKGLGRAVLTPILLVTYPAKYGVWNSRSENALKKLNLFPIFSAKDTFASKYIKVNEVLLELSSKYNISLWNLDGVFGEISGSSPLNIGTSEDEKVERTIEEQGITGITDVANFGMESHLEDFLITNWNKTIFSKEYDLIYEEGDLLSQQYQTPVGEIDILAISKDKKSYLIIELKKGRTTDAVVGQILRYMAWIKENLAKDKEIKGAVVVLESDEKLVYSIKSLNKVALYTYHVSFELAEHSETKISL